ncbi:MCE family protein [Actinokineospora cianjurensis]|uniref:Virulence factor Mce-like protein n=1 Tax=Actinokineospora cianjurensis TaxID=585224 RepID=A0A421AVB7_9PSEU|nr:MCE family protein [Actinokineospora cianjurensis]RLK53843.1 virulence factor Mce-like protein [Actinokineospora cianjurensis]
MARRGLKVLALGAVAVLLVVVGTAALFDTGKYRTVTAYFTAAIGLYPGSDVRVLGVAVGTVDAVHPLGPNVKVTMTIDASAPVPPDATALVITPSLVSDRYVQLAPVATDDRRIPDGAVIPQTRTVVPVELDQLFSSLDRLTTALGPDGANADGALSELVHTSQAYLEGNGADMGRTIRDLGDLARTLNGSQDDLFTTIDGLSRFTAVLAANDRQLRQVNEKLSTVTGFLVDERANFDAALHELAGALGVVQGFVRDNRGLVRSNVDNLVVTTRLLVDQRASLAEALDATPLALSNLLRAYDPATRTIDSRANLNEYSTPGGR